MLTTLFVKGNLTGFLWSQCCCSAHRAEKKDKSYVCPIAVGNFYSGNLIRNVITEQEPPEQSHHQPCKPELFHHQQAEERQQAAVDINPTEASGTTTGTIVTAVGMTYLTGTHLHRAPKRIGKVGIKSDAPTRWWMDTWQQDIGPAKWRVIKTSSQPIHRRIRPDR